MTYLLKLTRKVPEILFSLLFSFSLCASDIQLAGSSTIFPLAREIANSFTKKTRVFVNVVGGGSEIGVKYALNHNSGIGMLSRPLTLSEKKNGLEVYPFAIDGIVVIVSAENKINDLKSRDVLEVFSGKRSLWSNFGWNDGGKIHCVGSDSNHGSYEVFSELIGLNKQFTKEYSGKINHLLVMKEVARNKSAIGFVPLGQYLTYVVEKKVFVNIKPISIDSIYPTIINLKENRYLLKRNLSLVIKNGAQDNLFTLKDYFFTEDANKIIKKFGFTPLR